MSTATLPEIDSLLLVGETAGEVWHALDEHGPLSLTRLVKMIDAPRDVVLLGVGWLAREEKVQIDNVGRKRTVSLLP